MLTTTMPASMRAARDGHEGAGVGRRQDDRVDTLRDHLLHQVDLSRDVELVLDAVDDQVVLRGVLHAGAALAPSAMVLKNSLASDFMTSAIRGLPESGSRAHPASTRVSTTTANTAARWQR